MITIKIEQGEEIAIETEIGTLYLKQHMIEIGGNGLDFRTVLDIQSSGNIYHHNTPDNQVRFISPKD